MASEGLTNTAGAWHCAFPLAGITTAKFLLEYHNGCLKSNYGPNLDVKTDQSPASWFSFGHCYGGGRRGLFLNVFLVYVFSHQLTPEDNEK